MTEPVRPLEALIAALKHISEIATEGYSATEMDGFDQIRAIADVALLQASAPPAPTAEPPLLKTVLSGDGTKLLARFYDYEYFEEVQRLAVLGVPPERVSEGKELERLRNLARRGAYAEHLALNGMQGHNGLHDFQTCEHPDCVLIRAARPVVEPREEPDA